MKKINFLILFLLTSIPFSCRNEQQREINGNGYTGIIYAAKPQDKDVSFTPSNGEIKKVETQLKIVLSTILTLDTIYYMSDDKESKVKVVKDLDKYKRRYFGRISVEGNKIIMIDFLHPDCLFNTDEWKNPTWGMDGGGYCFWSIQYYMEDGDFFDFQLNAAI